MDPCLVYTFSHVYEMYVIYKATKWYAILHVWYVILGHISSFLHSMSPQFTPSFHHSVSRAESQSK